MSDGKPVGEDAVDARQVDAQKYVRFIRFITKEKWKQPIID